MTMTPEEKAKFLAWRSGLPAIVPSFEGDGALALEFYELTTERQRELLASVYEFCTWTKEYSDTINDGTLQAARAWALSHCEDRDNFNSHTSTLQELILSGNCRPTVDE